MVLPSNERQVHEQWLQEVMVLAQAIATEDPQTVSAVVCFILALTKHDFLRASVKSRWPTSGLTKWIKTLGEVQLLARKQVREMQSEALRGNGGRT